MTIHPVRLQLSRAKGSNLQAASIATNGLPAVNVARPSKWGNPFVAGEASGIFDGKDGRSLGIRDRVEVLVPALTLEQVIEYYRSAVEGMIGPEMYPHGHNWRDRFMMKSRAQWPNDAARQELRGKNLACWCPLGSPCHADVLLEIANR